MGVLIILILLVAIAWLFGYGFNWLWLRGGISKNGSAALPVCGQCGCPARGITTFHCPECGADLREVGIAKPGQNQPTMAGCFVPILYTVVLFIIGTSVMRVIDSQLPVYSQSSYEWGLRPQSGAYGEVSLEFEVGGTHQRGASQGRGISSSSSSSLSGGVRTQVSTIKMGNQLTNGQLRRLTLEVAPGPSQTVASRTLYFSIKPASLIATWNDAQGKAHQSAAALTDQDVLAFLQAAGADPTRPDVQQEAAELHAIIDGLANGMNHYTIQAFANTSISSSSSMSQGSSGFRLLYMIGWFIVWILGLVFIARRNKKKQQTLE